MKRQTLVVLALFLLPVLAAAQSASPSPPSIGLPLPQLGLPLPPIGLPLSPLGLPPRVDQSRQIGPAADGRRANPPTHEAKWRSRPATIVYFGSPYSWIDPAPQSSAGVSVAELPLPAPAPPTGRLALDVQPVTDLQLFVDGVYVGTMEDVGGALELEPGTRRIEIRAPKYEPIVFDARIVAQRTITYRGTLTPIEAPGAAVAPPAKATARPRQTFYLIPGCYLGNIPPQDVRLPQGCDLSRLITHTP